MKTSAFLWLYPVIQCGELQSICKNALKVLLLRMEEILSWQKGFIDINAHHSSQYLGLRRIDICNKLPHKQKLFEIAEFCCSSIADPSKGTPA